MSLAKPLNSTTCLNVLIITISKPILSKFSICFVVCLVFFFLILSLNCVAWGSCFHFSYSFSTLDFFFFYNSMYPKMLMCTINYVFFSIMFKVLKSLLIWRPEKDKERFHICWLILKCSQLLDCCNRSKLGAKNYCIDSLMGSGHSST